MHAWVNPGQPSTLGRRDTTERVWTVEQVVGGVLDRGLLREPVWPSSKALGW